MDLQQFISQSLIQVINGIHNAQVNFGKIEKIDDKDFKPLIAPTHINPQELNYAQIDFDIAVTAANNSINVYKGNIGIDQLEIKGQSNHEKQEVILSRIKFSIPILYPTTPNKVV